MLNRQNLLPIVLLAFSYAAAKTQPAKPAATVFTVGTKIQIKVKNAKILNSVLHNGTSTLSIQSGRADNLESLDMKKATCAFIALPGYPPFKNDQTIHMGLDKFHNNGVNFTTQDTKLEFACTKETNADNWTLSDLKESLGNAADVSILDGK